MTETIETLEIEPGWRVRIVPEQETEHANPRDADNVGLLVMPHPRYCLGDDSVTRNRSSIGSPWTAEHDAAVHAMRELPANLFARWARIFLGATVVLPVAMMDHSGLSCWVGAGPSAFDSGGWDSGQVGWIFDTAASREALGYTETPTVESMTEYLTGEVAAYNAYLTGSVVAYVVEHAETWRKDSDPEDERIEWEHVDSCGGFLIIEHARDLEDVREQARAEARAAIAAADAEG